MNSTAAIRIDHDSHCGNPASDPFAEFTTLMTPELLLRLRKLVAKYAHSCIEADDLLQDAVERALLNWHSFRPGTNLTAWLRTIIQRMAIDQWRRRGKQRNTVSVDDVIDPRCEEDPQPDWTQYGVEDVRRAMAALSDPLRVTYQMYWLDGMSYTTIASQLGIAEATVGTRLIRARTRLRQLLEEGTCAKVINLRENGSDLAVRSSGKAPPRWSPPRTLRRNLRTSTPPAATAASC